MCYDDKATPPNPPGVIGQTHGEDLVLTAADGNRFAAYQALPAKPSGAKVLIYPDVRGLFQFYKDLALRFAEVGIGALAFDYFGRTAGLTARDATFEFMPHVMQIKFETLYQDVEAGLTQLRKNSGPDEAIFVVGFCLGGALALQSGTNKQFGFSGLIPFYAGITRAFDASGSVLDNAASINYPVLGFFGGADPIIPNSAVQELGQKLDGAGIENELIIYPGAPHSFFDRHASEHAEASADAWKRLLDFMAKHQVAKN